MEAVSASGKEPISIFVEIRAAEKKADEILQNAANEKDRILGEARHGASSLILKRFEETDKDKAKKIQNFQSNVYTIRDRKISEAEERVKKIEENAKKNMSKAASLIFNKFIEQINGLE
ncbi:MAG: hypothetical protein Q8R04_07670 [Nanoarchaeota archaeon]|nr:hypothetical protein [Nanoarchaeota archaeon]